MAEGNRSFTLEIVLGLLLVAPWLFLPTPSLYRFVAYVICVSLYAALVGAYGRRNTIVACLFVAVVEIQVVVMWMLLFRSEE